MSDDNAGVTFTITEAARALGCDRQTVRRRLKAGKLPGAYQDHGGAWRIPHTALGAVDVANRSRTTAQEAPAPQRDDLADELARARAELAEWRARAEERERVIESQALTIRALMPGEEERPPPPPGRTALGHPVETRHGPASPGETVRGVLRWLRR